MGQLFRIGNCQITLDKKFDTDDHYSDDNIEVFVRGSGYWTGETRWLTGKEITKTYLKIGNKFVDKIDGFFLIIILDKIERSILIVTDHLNFFPLYYDNHAPSFFSDSLKSFTRNELDSESIFQYFSLGSLIGRRTIFENTKKLPAASLHFINELGELSHNLYWTCRPISTDKDEFKQIFSETISLISKLSNRPSLSLTAGLDSRMVFSELNRQGARFDTYTFGYPGATDVKTANKIASDFGIPHTSYDVGTSNKAFLKSFDPLLDQIQEYSDGMIPSINTIHTLYSFLDLKKEHDMVVTATGALVYSHYAEVPTLLAKDNSSIESIARFLTEFNSDGTSKSMLGHNPNPYNVLQNELGEYSFSDNQLYYDAFYLTKLSGLTAYIQQIAGSGIRIFNPIFTKKIINHSIGLPPELRNARGLQRDIIIENNPKLNNYLVNGFKVVHRNPVNFLTSKTNYALRLSQKTINKIVKKELFRMSYIHYPSLLEETQLLGTIIQTEHPQLQAMMKKTISENLPISFLIKYASLKSWLDRN